MKTEKAGNRTGGALLIGVGTATAVVALNSLIESYRAGGWEIFTRTNLQLTLAALVFSVAGSASLIFGLRLLFEKTYLIVLRSDGVHYAGGRVFNQSKWVEPLENYRGVLRKITPARNKKFHYYEIILKHYEHNRDITLFRIKEPLLETTYWDKTLAQFEAVDPRAANPLSFSDERSIKLVFWEQRWRTFARILHLPLLDSAPKNRHRAG